VVGADRQERSEERTNHRNGHRPRSLTSQVGDLALQVPRLRASRFPPSSLEPRRRLDQARYAVIMKACIGGVSTRIVDSLVGALGSQSASPGLLRSWPRPARTGWRSATSHSLIGARSGAPTCWSVGTSHREVRSANGPIQRRSRVVGIFPNEDANGLRPTASTPAWWGRALLKQDEHWQLEGRRMFSAEGMAALPDLESLPALPSVNAGAGQQDRRRGAGAETPGLHRPAWDDNTSAIEWET
jgi:transposase-like protein